MIEGIDGSGKSTLAKVLSQTLNKQVVHFPTSEFSAIKDHIDKKLKLEKEQLFLLFLADIALHKKSLENTIVDRYVYSTLAYQQGILSLSEAEALLERLAFPRPSIVLYLDISPVVALKRIRNSKRELTAFEQAEYLKEVRQKYLEMAQHNFFGNWLVLDATQSIDKLRSQLFDNLNL